MQINERLKELRKENKLTQEEIGNKLGILKQAYYRYEKGQRSIPVEHIQILCRLYNISADYILCLTDEKRPLF